MAATDSKARRFAAACGALSQCVKAAEKAVAPTSPFVPAMPGANVPAQEPTPLLGRTLTIFYGGRVVAFDGFPPDKAAELIVRLAAAAGAGAGASARWTATGLPRDAPGDRSSELVDMPIARRVSLQRFLEKRKDRLGARGPYGGTSSAVEKAAEAACGDHLTIAL